MILHPFQESFLRYRFIAMTFVGHVVSGDIIDLLMTMPFPVLLVPSLSLLLVLPLFILGMLSWHAPSP